MDEDITPLDEDGVSAVTLGTVLWAVALVVLWVFFRDDLTAHGAQWWLYVCVSGAGFGLLGIWYTRRRRAAYRRAAAGGRS